MSIAPARTPPGVFTIRVARNLEETVRHVAMALALAPQVSSERKPLHGGRLQSPIETGLSWSDSEARDEWKNWVLTAGFRDASEAISETLIAAQVYLARFKRLREIGRDPEPSTEDLGLIAKAAKKFDRYTLPDKLSSLEREYGFKFNALSLVQISSIHTARNCLVHRKGVVSFSDVGDSGALAVTWAGLDAIIGERSEVGEDGVVKVSGGENHIHIARPDRLKRFCVGERISFDGREFSEITGTILDFAEDVLHGLRFVGRRSGATDAELPD